MNAVADRYRTLADQLESTIASVKPDVWVSPTPCSEWTAADLVAHVVGVHGMMLGFVGRQLSSAPSATADPLAAFRSARRDMEAVLDDPELATAEYDGLLGRTDISSTVDRFLAFDLVIHRWDLAAATGQDATIPAGELERVWNDVHELGDSIRRPGICGPAVEVADDAPLEHRVLAYLGRDPAWTAAAPR